MRFSNKHLLLVYIVLVLPSSVQTGVPVTVSLCEVLGLKISERWILERFQELMYCCYEIINLFCCYVRAQILYFAHAWFQ